MSIRSWGRVALAAGALMATGVTGAGPAHAAPGCTGSGCNGLNPIVRGCVDDATEVNRVVFEDNAAGGTSGTIVVRLMYSPSCDASWARTTGNGTGTAHVTKVRAWVAGHKTNTLRVRNSKGAVASKMWSASSINVCGSTTWNGSVNVKRCTSAG